MCISRIAFPISSATLHSSAARLILTVRARVNMIEKWVAGSEKTETHCAHQANEMARGGIRCFGYFGSVVANIDSLTLGMPVVFLPP